MGELHFTLWVVVLRIELLNLGIIFDAPYEIELPNRYIIKL